MSFLTQIGNKIQYSISKCSHPVFTGIGHEIDTSIADIVAHTANKTPTACAQSVIAIVENFLSDLSYSAGSLRSLTQTAVERARSRIAVSVERLRTRPRTALERQSQKLMMHAASVRLLDPVTTMARGWSITRDSSGNVVRSISDIKKVIDKHGVIGVAAGSLFVFKGKYKAVLINYPNREEKLRLFN